MKEEDYQSAYCDNTCHLLVSVLIILIVYYFLSFYKFCIGHNFLATISKFALEYLMSEFFFHSQQIFIYTLN